MNTMDDAFWQYLTKGAELMPENWNKRCQIAIRTDRARVEDKYGVRIKRTEVYCSKCGHPSTHFFHFQKCKPQQPVIYPTLNVIAEGTDNTKKGKSYTCIECGEKGKANVRDDKDIVCPRCLMAKAIKAEYQGNHPEVETSKLIDKEEKTNGRERIKVGTTDETGRVSKSPENLNNNIRRVEAKRVSVGVNRRKGLLSRGKTDEMDTNPPNQASG